MFEWTNFVPVGKDSSYAPVRNEDRRGGARQVRLGRTESPVSSGTSLSFESWLRADNLADDAETSPRSGGYASYYAFKAQQASDAYQSRANLIALVTNGIIVNDMRGGQERRGVSFNRSASTYVSRDHAIALYTYEFNMHVVFGARHAPPEMRVELLI